MDIHMKVIRPRIGHNKTRITCASFHRYGWWGNSAKEAFRLDPCTSLGGDSGPYWFCITIQGGVVSGGDMVLSLLSSDLLVLSQRRAPKAHSIGTPTPIPIPIAIFPVMVNSDVCGEADSGEDDDDEGEGLLAVPGMFVDEDVDADVDKDAVLVVEVGLVTLKYVETNPPFSSGLIQRKKTLEYERSNPYTWTTHVKLVT